MRIGGLQKCSLIDYPGKIAAVVFAQGCPWRCPFCHNAALVLPHRFGPPLDEKAVFSFLESRRGCLDGVVVGGGEPTFQKDLGAFLQKLKALGFLVKVDTNGSRPELIEHLLEHEWVDAIAMDVKAPLEKYGKAAGRPAPAVKIMRSIDLIRDSGIPCEFRTTAVPGLLAWEDIFEIARLLTGARRYVLQHFENRDPLDPQLKNAPAFPWRDAPLWEEKIASMVDQFLIR